MLTQAIRDLLPVAIAVALSPIPVIAVVLVLGTPRARRNGPAFAAGWSAGLLVATVVLVLLADAAEPEDAAASGTDWVLVILGVLFLGLAIKQWIARPKPGQSPRLPGWMATIDTIAPARAVVLGVALSAANPKNLALTAAGAASIAHARLTTSDAAVAVAVFVATGSITVVGAVIFYLAATDRAAGPLDALKAFMTRYNAVIMTSVLLLLGAKLLAEGFARA